jgi:hypothetical protein
MHAHKLDITVPSDRRISLELPEDFPTGPAELIVLAAPAQRQRIVRLGGTLGGGATPAPSHDIIADVLDEMRHDRRVRFEGFGLERTTTDAEKR